MEPEISLTRGDITKLSFDAIVNAANKSLLGGGGVDGAIHRAAGPGLMEVCRLLGGCETGQAKTTNGFNLPAKFIIHTVGPVWHGGHQNEQSLLADCYRNSLDQAVLHDCHTIAFPNISTGVYGFPKVLAAETAIAEVKKYLERCPGPLQVTFVCFDEENFNLYSGLLNHK
jgi:O-acetyl-ADP-ribose deacetylase (regulator of RNase III)